MIILLLAKLLSLKVCNTSGFFQHIFALYIKGFFFNFLDIDFEILKFQASKMSKKQRKT